MRTVGIIAEYNPFHTGHAYHIRKAKEITGADYCIAVISPDYVQRGEAAIFDKYTRAHMALLNGADLVLQLPVCYATGSAEYFAEGATALLDSLGTVDAICFGAETDDIRLMQSIAHILNEEPPLFKKMLQAHIANGLTFPQAREIALTEYLASTNQQTSELNTLLASPNNILGIEYCKAILKRNSSMKPYCLKRQGDGYHETKLDQLNQSEYKSASAIRTNISDHFNVLPYIPANSHQLFIQASACKMDNEDFLPYLYERILNLEKYKDTLDLTSELYDRILKLRYQLIGKSYSEIVSQLKSRQYTEARIRRVLLHLILSISATGLEASRTDQTVYYARILGMNKEAAPLMHQIKTSASIPLISKTANAPDLLRQNSLCQWETDLYASHLYQAARAQKYHTTFKTEYQHSPIVL